MSTQRDLIRMVQSAWKKAPDEMKVWVKERFDTEKAASPDNQIWIGATDFRADFHIAAIDDNEGKGSSGLFGTTPYSEYEACHVDAICRMWAAGKTRVVMSVWDGATMRAERCYEPPEIGDNVAGHFAIETMLLTGVIYEPKPGFIDLTPDHDAAWAMSLPPRMRQ